MNEAKLSVEDARRIIRDCQMFEDEHGITDAGRTPTYHVPMARLARITGCTLATGYATIQFLTGDPGGTLTPDTSLTVKAFIGKDSWWRKDDDIVVVPVACPNVTWVAVAGVNGPKFWKPPEESDLAPDGSQDHPDPDEYCEETVQVP